MKKCIYTVITDKYDYPFAHSLKFDGWDYICFTDELIESDFWEIRPIPEELKSLDYVRLNRAIKIRPHIYLSDYNYSIYIDGNYDIPIIPVIHNDFLRVNGHESRKCLYDEAANCIYNEKDTAENIDRLIAFYKSLGMPPNYGLYHCHFISRWHNHPTCKDIMDDWWKQVQNYSWRDQISFPYILWKYSYHPNYNGCGYIYHPHSLYGRERQTIVPKTYNAEINPRIALCCIERLENLYIREFVNYYKSLGVGHIFMYDTNNPELDDVNDVIGDFILDGYVELIKWSGKPMWEVREAYNDCYHNRLSNYDWCIFVDPDEYLELYKEDNITDYLNRLSDFDCICVNWRNMDDNDLVYNDGRPLRLRFTRTSNIKHDIFFKSIVKTGLEDVDFVRKGSAHGPFLSAIKMCDNTGKQVKNLHHPIFKKYNWNDAAIIHYRCKTIEEYVRNKQVKLKGYHCIRFDMQYFFQYNIPTEEKINLYKLLENENR